MTVAALPSVLRLCALNEIPVGLGRSFRVAGRLIAVFRSRSGRVYAVDGVCPHRGGPLADGMLAGEHVVCPLHAFRFHGDSGGCDQPSVCAIRTYPVDVVDGAVCVSLPE
jgi:nitrite reductase (NADH) small subunit